MTLSATGSFDLAAGTVLICSGKTAGNYLYQATPFLEHFIKTVYVTDCRSSVATDFNAAIHIEFKALP